LADGATGGLHPQVQALLAEAGREADEPAPADLEAQRAGYLDTAMRLGGAREPVAEVQDVVIGGTLRARAYRPMVVAEPLGAVVWLHGGGWMLGDLEGFDHVCRALTLAAGHVVVSVEYRLAPEHPFPAAVQDARRAVAWALGHGAGQLGYDPERVVAGGDSAGGNLAAGAARRAGAGLRGQLLVYPATDAAMETGSYAEFAGGPMLTRDQMARCYEAYLGGADPSDPEVSPLRCPDLAGAPPAFVAVAGHDPLRDDGLRYAEALRAAGVPVEVRVYDDMVHGFLRWGGVVERAHELVGELGAAARRMLA
jgi:acetyl esterase/lipase